MAHDRYALDCVLLKLAYDRLKTTHPFTGLDWAMLESWAGAKTLSKGKEYQRKGKLSSLVRSRDGMLVVWVAGSKRYATGVTHPNGLDSACTWLAGESCKYAVAVVLEYIALREKGIVVPLPAPHDPRIARLDLSDGAPAEYKDVAHYQLQLPLSHLSSTGPGRERPSSPPPG